MKVGAKRRRTKAQMAEDRQEASRREEEMARQEQTVAQLQAHIRSLQAENANNAVAADILNRW